MLIKEAFDNPLFPQFVSESGFNNPDEFDDAEVKVLCIFPSAPNVRVISDTQAVLYNIMKGTFGKQVFVDWCFTPLESMRGAYNREFPPIVGSFGKRSWEDYDVLLISIALTREEFASAYSLLKAAKFPLNHQARLHDDRTPFIGMGGVAVDSSTALHSNVDMVILGLGERTLIRVVKAAMEVQQERGSVARGKAQMIQKLKDFEGFLYPHAYHYTSDVRNGVIEHHLDSVDEGFPAVVRPDVNLPIEKYGHFQDQQHYHSLCSNQRKATILLSWGCASAPSCCTFCAEGNLYGVWRERSLEALEKACFIAKKSSLGETFNGYSFNSLYHSHYIELLSKSFKYFDKISSLNFRHDVLAYQPAYLDLLKELGSLCISTAIEGFSENIRQNLLNKNLSNEEILEVARFAFKKRFMRFKTGIIWTGYETKEDFEEGFDLFRQMKDIRDKSGANTFQKISITKLNNMPGTPLYFKPRVMAYESWMDSFNGNYFNYPFFPLVDMGAKVKLCSRTGDEFIQQLLIDSGSLGKDLILDTGVGMVSGCRDHRFAVNSKMVEMGIDPKKQFLDFDPKKSPFQHLRISYSEDISLRNPKITSILPEDNPPKVLCIKTPATVGRGDKLKCYGCGQCEAIDKEREVEGLGAGSYRKEIQNRELFCDFKPAEIAALKMENQPNFFYSILFIVTSKGQYISKEHLTRRYLIKLFEAIGGDDIFVNFRKLTFQTSKYHDYLNLVSNYSGYEMVHFGLKDPFEGDFNDYLEQANSQTEGIKALSVEDLDLSAGVPEPYALYDLTLNLPREKADAVIDYIKTHPFRTYLKGQYKDIYQPFYYKMLFLNNRPHLFFFMRVKVNPAFTLSGLFTTGKVYKAVTCKVRGLFYQVGPDFYSYHKKEKLPIDLSTFKFVENNEDEVDIDDEEVLEMVAH